MIQIERFTFNPFLENCYLLYDETRDCIIIDPGCYDPREKVELKSFVEREGLKVVKLLNTHCHIDHVFGNAFVKQEFDVKLGIHKKDVSTLASVKVYAPPYGFNNYEETTADYYLEDGGIIEFGNSHLDIIFVPGHAPGHVAFVNKEQSICIAGDVLFRESIGRTDLPGGDHDTLIRSIREKMFDLPDDMRIYPGHGPETDIGHEKVFNPFCALPK